MNKLTKKLAVTVTASTVISMGVGGANSAIAASMWEFGTNPNAPGQVIDTVGLVDNGSYINVAPNNGILTLNGSNQYISIPDNNSLDFGAGDLLIAARVLTTSTSGLGLIVDKRLEASAPSGALTGTKGYAFFLVNGNLGFQLADGVVPSGSSVSYTNYLSNVFVADGNFHDLLVTVDRDQLNGLKFFVDGVQRFVGNPTVEAGSLDNDQPLTIGRRSNSSDPGFFNGRLDYVCVSGGLSKAVCSTGITSYSEKPAIFDPLLFTLEGRAGGTTSYEYAIGPRGAQTSNTGTIEQNWVNNQPVNWVLNWNPDTNTASFQLVSSNGAALSSPINYSFSGTKDTFNGLCLAAKSLLSPKVDAGTISEVKVTSATIKKTNGNSITSTQFAITPDGTTPGPTTLSTSATAGLSEFNQACYGFNNSNYQEFTQLTGTAMISWSSGDPVTTGGGAQSNVTFQIKGYDPPSSVSSPLEETPANQDPQSVPEPKSITGLLILGMLGTVSTLRRK